MGSIKWCRKEREIRLMERGKRTSRYQIRYENRNDPVRLRRTHRVGGVRTKGGRFQVSVNVSGGLTEGNL